jgi:hypothetical protein
MKIIPTVLALCLSVVPLASTVAAPVEQSLKFSAAVPADEFKIEPGTPWPAAGVVTEFKYNKVNNQFTRYANSLTITSSGHDVTAKIQSPAVLSDGTNTIAVAVQIAGTRLSTTPKMIHPKGPNSGTYELDIVPVPTGSPKAGTYTSEIILIFDGV